MKNIFILVFTLFSVVRYPQNEYTNELNEVEITYKYRGRNSYNLKGNDSISYRFLSGSGSDV
jgi:hypothetical protein